MVGLALALLWAPGGRYTGLISSWGSHEAWQAKLGTLEARAFQAKAWQLP